MPGDVTKRDILKAVSINDIHLGDVKKKKFSMVWLKVPR